MAVGSEVSCIAPSSPSTCPSSNRESCTSLATRPMPGSAARRRGASRPHSRTRVRPTCTPPWGWCR
jgi:hypothetical protein